MASTRGQDKPNHGPKMAPGFAKEAMSRYDMEILIYESTKVLRSKFEELILKAAPPQRIAKFLQDPLNKMVGFAIRSVLDSLRGA